MSIIKTLLLLVILGAIAWGVYYWSQSMPAKTDTTDTATTTASVNDNSDQALAQDLANINAEANAFSSDNAELDSSLSGTASPQ